MAESAENAWKLSLEICWNKKLEMTFWTVNPWQGEGGRLHWSIINKNTHISLCISLYLPLHSVCNWHWTSGACMRVPPHSDNILTHLSVRQLRQSAASASSSSTSSTSSWSWWSNSGRSDKFENYEHNSSLDHASDNGTVKRRSKMKWNGIVWNESEKEIGKERAEAPLSLPLPTLARPNAWW